MTDTYLWGEDVSGSMQGAGGVGGLLAVTDSSGTYYPVYDGNSNIRAYTDASGAVVAEYEYDAFGKIIFQSGSKADDFVFRFSTKYYDKETGLYYYGDRYYSPDLRRWLNRDPMGENGGVNLYEFCLNNSLRYYDYLGQDTVSFDHEGRLTIAGPISDWISDKISSFNGTRRSPNNDYEEFLVYYRQNKSKFHYDYEYFNRDAVGQRRDPNVPGWLTDLLSGTEKREFLLKDPDLQKFGKGVWGAIGTPQSHRELENLEEVYNLDPVTDVPGGKTGQGSTIEDIFQGSRLQQGNTRNENMSRIASGIQLVMNGVAAANKNDAVLIKTFKFGDSIQWIAGVRRTAGNFEWEKDETMAKLTVNLQYFYYNICNWEQLPYPFGNRAIPKFLKY